MDTLLGQLLDLRDKCVKYQNEINTKLGSNDIKVGYFNIIHNHAVATLELLGFYKKIWETPSMFRLEVPKADKDLKRAKKENAERIIEATKCLFIKSLSAIEYCAKGTIKDKRHPLHLWYQEQKSKNRRIYLSKMISESYKRGLINKKQKESWDCLIDMRNIIVHNNGIADKNVKYSINDLEIIFEENKMTKGKLDTFIKLTNIAVDLYYSWVLVSEKYKTGE